MSYSASPTCRLDITMLTAAGTIGPNERLIIRYRTQLDSNTQNGVALTNIAGAIQWFNGASGNPLREVSTGTLTNGTPSLSDHEDSHTVTIVSATSFLVQKISTDLTGDPNNLLAGETLRYTITANNTGNADAVNVVLRDAVPANTTYVAGSTTLNGAAVADVGGLSPLVTGMLIHSPANPTPGLMPADPSSNPANAATITFDVVVNSSVADGTVISNQGFVTATANGIVDQPSDDPDTPIANDPTRDVVGNLPLLYAEKRVALSVDLGSPGVIDPGDTLRYTITVQNSAAIASTGVVLTDAVPANTTYVANSTLLNGSPVGQPDGGVSPLASGVNAGTISPGTTTTLQFDLRVNPGTPVGTLISNQAVVDSVELPNLLTDGDGNPATGPEPTVVVVGAGQQLSITKQVTVVGGGAALPGSTLEYVVRVTNIAAVPATSVVITDDIDASSPGQLAYVSGSATMNGLTSGVTFAGSTITADYATVNGPLGPGAVVLLRFRAALNTSLPNGAVVTNTGVVAWNNPSQTATASASIVVGSIPGTLPSLYAEKRVTLFVDLGSPGIVDPGDTLRYTITTENSGANAATGVVLRDTVPANTTYVANSTLLNGSPFGQPDGGVSPLASGINAGTITPGATSTLQFDLRVNAGTPAGTLIRNQAVVDSVELPDLLTDGDGNRSTGPEPTVIVVGVGQQLSITKQVTVVGGGAALAGATLEYVVNATNIGPLPAINVVITDDIGTSAPGQLAYVSGSATMNGSTAGVSVVGSAITANYAALIGPLGPGAAVVLRFRAVLDPGLATGTVVSNTGVVGWNNPTQTASASVSTVIGTLPGLSALNGAAWHDADFDDVRDPGERPLVGWSVEVYRNNQLWNSVLTDANGFYRFIAVEPNDVTGIPYELRFRAPGAGANTAMLGRPPHRSRMECSGSRTSSCRPARICRPEPADPSERRHLQLDRAHTDCRGDAFDVGCRQRLALAGELLRRCGPARTDHARGRLLQVRRQLQRPGLPERRRLPHRGDGAVGIELRCGLFADHPADVRRFDCSVLGAGLPGQRQRCDPWHSPVLRSAAFGVRAGCIGSATQRRHDPPRPLETGRQPDAGHKPDLQQPHPARSGYQRLARDLQDDATALRDAAGSWFRTRSP